MSNVNTKKRDWVDIATKILTPIMAGLLIAWAGFVSNETLSDVSSKQESARLITELQIRREQAESELRKDVFDQALQAFLIKDAKKDKSINGMSKQLLRLELLSLNFGDSLSLSPLFAEFKKDVRELKLKDSTNESGATFDDKKADLKKRLISLARRVASTQISSLAQHGVIKEFEIPLDKLNDSIYSDEKEKENGNWRCIMLEDGFLWPDQEIVRQLTIYEPEAKLEKINASIADYFSTSTHSAISNEVAYLAAMNDMRSFSLNNIDRYIDISISNVNTCDNTSNVTFTLYKRNKEAANFAANKILVTSITSLGELSDTKNYVLRMADRRKYDALLAAEAKRIQESLDDNVTVETDTQQQSDMVKAEFSKEELKVMVRRRFKLDYFNFPMVDNSRLDNNHRFAIVLDEIDTISDPAVVKFIGIIFPSEYASLRDRTGMKEARQLLEDAMKDAGK